MFNDCSRMLSDQVIKNYIIDSINRGYTINFIKTELNKRGSSDTTISRLMKKIGDEGKYGNFTTTINFTLNKFILWLLRLRWYEIRDKNLNYVFLAEKVMNRKKWLIGIKFVALIDQNKLDEIKTDFSYVCQKHPNENIINIVIANNIKEELKSGLSDIPELKQVTLMRGSKSTIIADLASRKIVTKPLVYPMSYSRVFLPIRGKLTEELLLEINLNVEESIYKKLKSLRIMRGLFYLLFVLILLFGLAVKFILLK